MLRNENLMLKDQFSKKEYEAIEQVLDKSSYGQVDSKTREYEMNQL